MKHAIYNETQRKALVIVTIIALVFGAYFLRHFFIVIAFAAILAYICNPLYKRFLRRSGKSGSAASLTLLIAMLAVIIPFLLVVFVTGLQINSLINVVRSAHYTIDIENTRGVAIDWVNSTAAHYGLDVHLTPDSINSAIANGLQALSNALLSALRSTASSVFSFMTTIIIFIYVFISLLKNQKSLIRIIAQLNPLGKEATDLYLKKAGAMTNAMVRGQFVIAFAQGVTDALLVYVGGFHYGFLFFALLFTVLSIIPLGGGIIAIPIGIAMMLSGNIAGGLFVIIGHILIVTNIDNILRPRLVPDTARLDPALLLLSVFAGIGLFGFIGLVLGPVVMILITTTVSVFLMVFKDVAMDDAIEAPAKQGFWQRLKGRDNPTE